MRIIYINDHEVFNARKIKLFLKDYGLIVWASGLTTILTARILNLI